MMRASNPLHEVLRQQVGLDSFAIDGDESVVLDPWSDRPERAHTPITR